MTYEQIGLELKLPKLRSAAKIRLHVANIQELDREWKRESKLRTFSAINDLTRFQDACDLINDVRIRSPVTLPLRVMVVRKFKRFIKNGQLVEKPVVEFVEWDYLPVAYEPKSTPQPNAVAIGPIIKSTPVIVDYRSNNNWLRGMIKRVAHTVNPKHKAIKKFSKFVGFWLKNNATPLDHFEMSHELLDEQWLNDAKHYTLKQKQEMHKFLDKYMQDRDPKIGRYEDIYACNSFIKREWYSETKEPRIINARSDVFKALVAPYIKMIEHSLIYNEHFIKGRTPNQRVQRMQEIAAKFGYVCESDYSSFEGSFSLEFQHACEFQMFKYMLQNNPEPLKIIGEIYQKQEELSYKEKQILKNPNDPRFSEVVKKLRRIHTPPFNKMISANSRKWHDHCLCQGSRMSGDMWTSLANGFSNMMLFLYSFKHTVDSIRTPRPEVLMDFIVEGDDGFFAANIPFAERFEKDVSDLGFKIKIVHGTDINDLQFCSTCLGPNNTPVPDFWRSIEKFGWSFDSVIIQNYSDRPTKYETKMLYAKALSLNAESQGIPILQPLSIKIAELTGKPTLKSTIFGFWEKDVLKIDDWVLTQQPITEEMRRFFAKRFGISVEDQLKLEEYIEGQHDPRFVIPIDRASGSVTLEGL